MAADGWEVWATMRNPDRDGPALLSAAGAAGVELTIQGLDITDENSVTEAFQRAGDVEVLINNAVAQGAFGSVEESSLDDWRLLIETNLLGTVRCMQAVLPGMRARRSGCIINVSTSSVPVAFPGTGVYAASKAAMEHISEVAAIEGRLYGVRIVVIEPGLMATNPQLTGSLPTRDSPYWSSIRNTMAYLSANFPYASHPDVVAAAIVRAARDPDTPFRVTTGQAAAETVALRRGHTDDEWLDLLGSRRFTDIYRPPEPDQSRHG
jgi:NAD(P)-dependent dehydrogenase (short-subunit alcohol dehydrogenase family)